MKLKILINLYRTYYPGLLDVGVLLEGLKELPKDMVVENKFQNIGMGMPSTKIELTVKQRIEELEHDKIFSRRKSLF